MICLILLILMILFLFFSSKKIRVPPKTDRFILSPIDGQISNVQKINIDDSFFFEITINFLWNSDRTLYSPLKGEYKISEETTEKSVVILDVNKSSSLKKEDSFQTSLNSNQIQISHYPNYFLAKLNVFSDSFLNIYENQMFNSSMPYGSMMYGSHIKVLIHSDNDVIVVKNQTVVGGESILAIIKFTN